MSRFFYAEPSRPRLAVVEAAIRPILRGAVDPDSKDEFDLWVDRLTRSVAVAAIEALTGGKIGQNKPASDASAAKRPTPPIVR